MHERTQVMQSLSHPLSESSFHTLSVPFFTCYYHLLEHRNAEAQAEAFFFIVCSAVQIYAATKSQSSTHSKLANYATGPVEQLIYMTENKSEEINACVQIRSS